MAIDGYGPRTALGMVAAAAAAASFAWPLGAQSPAPSLPELAAHRAVYDLKLVSTRGKSSTVNARGRILYDFTGSTCAGYTLDFRQVTELDNGEGKVTLSDLRSRTWEDGAAKNYTFSSQNNLNRRLVDEVDGKAERHTGTIAVTLTKPKARKLDLDAGIVFPTEHVRKTLIAARDGQTILEFPVYDGSETGEKVYNTLTVIGRPIGTDERAPNDVAAGNKAVAGLKRWPVTISYFDRNAKAGEQMPVYSISFEVYENGISRALVLDYNQFSIAGNMTTLETRDSKPCP
jgi:EipB-like